MKDIPFTGNPPLQVLPLQEPIDYFRDIISDEVIARIVEESNTYAAQVDIDKPLNLTSDELEQFIGILLLSVVKMPATRDYWERFLQYYRIASIMSIRRFERIKRFLHCNDNEKMDKDFPDKLFKICPLIDALKERFHLIAPTELLCIDEQMVAFKGRSMLKQYNPQKPKKWGYKFYVLTNLDGLIYDFVVHTGTIDVCPGQPDLQASGNIVMQLLANIPRHKGHKLFIDNWYTGVPLATTLMNQGIALVGTVRANRLRNCTMPPDKDMKKEGRGTVAIQTCKSDGVELRAIKWFDNQDVSMLTKYEAVEPTSQVRRWDRKQKKEVFVECPSAVVTYNKSMGGVDLLDGLLSYYRIPVRSKKWYHRLIWHCLDVSVVQGWLLYRRDAGAEKVLSLKEFKVSVAESLMKQGKSVNQKRPPVNVGRSSPQR